MICLQPIARARGTIPSQVTRTRAPFCRFTPPQGVKNGLRKADIHLECAVMQRPPDLVERIAFGSFVRFVEYGSDVHVMLKQPCKY